MLLRLDPEILIILIPALILSLCVHEYAHGIVAYYYGDDTAYRAGRLTLNPLKHLDPIGSLMLLFIGFGYAKPVPVNTFNLSNPNLWKYRYIQMAPVHAMGKLAQKQDLVYILERMIQEIQVKG